MSWPDHVNNLSNEMVKCGGMNGWEPIMWFGLQSC
jgi:hypothetical protein